MPIDTACLSRHGDVRALQFAEVYSAHFSKAKGPDEKAGMRPAISVFHFVSTVC